MRLAAELFPGIFIMLLFAAHWPDLDQPGKTPREALLLLGTPLLLALILRGGEARWHRGLVALVAVPVLAGLGRLATTTATEQVAVARDLVILAAPWLVAVGASRLGAYRSLTSGLYGWIELGASLTLAGTGLVGLSQAWLGFEGLAQTQAPAATFVNRNVATQAIVPLLPLALPGLLRFQPGWKRWLSGIGVGLAGAFIITTRTRGGWLGLFFGLGCAAAFWLLSRRRQSAESFRIGWGPVALAVALVGMAFFVPSRGSAPSVSVGRTLLTLAKPTQGAVRPALWGNTTALVADHPWSGVGAGRFAIAYPPYQAARHPTPRFALENQPEHPHNDFLEYAAELGIPAALALCAILFWAIARAFHRVGRADSALEAGRSAVLGASLVAVAIHGLVSFPLHSPASAFVTWFLAGLALSGPRARATLPRWRRVAFWILLAMSVPWAWIGFREVRSQRAIWLGMRAAQEQRCEEALPQVSRQRRYAPWRRRDRGLAAMISFHCDKDAERSLSVIESALELQPHQLNLLLAAGHRSLQLQRYDDAEAAFREAIGIDDTIGQSWLGLAMTYHAGEDTRSATEACENASRMAPRFDLARRFCEANGYLP